MSTAAPLVEHDREARAMATSCRACVEQAAVGAVLAMMLWACTTTGRLVHRGDGWNDAPSASPPASSVTRAPATGQLTEDAGRVDAAELDGDPYDARARLVDSATQPHAPLRPHPAKHGAVPEPALAQNTQAVTAPTDALAPTTQPAEAATLVLAGRTEARYVAITNVADDPPASAWHVAAWHTVLASTVRASERLKDYVRTNPKWTLAALLALVLLGTWRHRHHQRRRRRWFR